MIYQFKCINSYCPKELEVQDVEMKMSEYTDKVHCPICGDLMHRPIETMVSNYKDCTGFYGKKS